MNIAIEQIQHGNEQAFKSLFDEYYQGLCVFASAYLKDDDLSADVVQEAFVKFWILTILLKSNLFFILLSGTIV